MAERSPKRAKAEMGKYTNTKNDEILAGISVEGLGGQLSARKRRKFEVEVQNINELAMTIALDLAGGDPRRLQLNKDGSVTVNNNPRPVD